MPDKDKKDNAVPAGSKPVDNSKATKAEPGQSDDQKAGAKDQPPASADNKAAAATDDKGSQAKGDGAGAATDQTGQKSTEELMKSIEDVNRKLDGLSKTSEDGKTEVPDHDAQLGKLDEMLKGGEIDLEQYQKQSREIMRQQSQEQAAQAVDKRLEEQKLEEASDKYMQDNPDFHQYMESPELKQLMKQNPLFDEVSGFERLKRMEAEAKSAELNKQIEQLQHERDQAVKNGAHVTDSVGKDSGAAIQHGEIEENKNLSAREGMLAALRRSRQAA